MKKIGFYPEGSDENQYFHTMCTALHMAGYDIVDYESALKDPNISVINFNFLENIIAKNKTEAFLKYIKRRIILTKCKMRRKKIVFTMHNKIPHDSRYEKYSKKIMLKAIKQAEAIHILSNASVDVLKLYMDDDSVENKCFYIPHPNYIGVYDTDLSFERNQYAEKDEMIVLFFGQVREYKNIEILINVANKLKEKKIVFLIAGRPQSEEYAQSLKKMIGDNKKIKTIFKFLPDDEITAWIQLSDIVVFPYSKRSSLNSGTVFLAASKGKSIICPAIASMMQMRDKDAFFIYDYNTSEEHEAKLTGQILKAYEIFENDASGLEKLGQRALKEVETNNSLDVIAEAYKKMLGRID